MKRFVSKIKSRAKLNNVGSTMVEVLVAFTVLALVLASLLGIVKLSGTFLAKSEQMVHKQEEFNRLYYKKDVMGEEMETVSFTLQIEEETSIPLDHLKIERYNSVDNLGMEDFQYTVYKFKRKE